MATLTQNMLVRFPRWRDDYISLGTALGFPPESIMVFVLEHSAYSMDEGKTWRSFGR